MTGTSAPQPVRPSIRAVLTLRCPRCWQGAMFASPVRMNASCPACAYQYDRGNGYFIGAMYSSYGLSLGFCALLAGALWLAEWGVWPIVATCGAAIAVLGPLVIFPYSRLLWVWVERDGWLHDGQEDVASLRRAHMLRGGLIAPPGPGNPDASDADKAEVAP